MSSFQRYLTDSDRALDRDANTMLNARGYEGAGYIAQGYANMDVLPDQLMLQDLIQKRQQINANSREFRREQSLEDSKVAEQDEFEGYSSFVSGLKALPEQERVARIRNRMIENPSLATNKLVSDANQNMLAGDKAVLDAQSNILKSKQNELEMKEAEFGLGDFENQAKLSELQRENAFKGAQIARDQLDQTAHNFSQGIYYGAGRDIFNMGAFDEDQKESRDKLIKITADLALDDKPESKETLRSLTDITGAMAIAKQVKQLKRFHLQRNPQLIKDVWNEAGVNLSALPADRVARDAEVLKAQNELIKKGKLKTLGEFNHYMEKAKGFNESEDALNALTADFLGSIEKISALLNSSNPEDQKALRGEMALINAKAQAQLGYVERERANEADEFKREKEESEIRKRDADANEKRRNSTNAARKVLNQEYANEFNRNMSASKDEMSRLKWAQKLVDDQAQDSLGLPSDATVKDVLNYAKTMAPPAQPGLAPRGYGDKR